MPSSMSLSNMLLKGSDFNETLVRLAGVRDDICRIVVMKGAPDPDSSVLVIDADGLEILDSYRSRGLPVRSVLMDCSAWNRFEPFGNDYTTGKAPLSKHRRLDLSALTESEQELYDLLTDPSCPGHRRVEQELIPYDEFFAALP